MGYLFCVCVVIKSLHLAQHSMTFFILNCVFLRIAYWWFLGQKAQASGAPLNTQASGAPLNTQASGAPLNTQASGTPLNTQASGALLNTQASGAPLNTQASGAPLNTQNWCFCLCAWIKLK